MYFNGGRGSGHLYRSRAVLYSPQFPVDESGKFVMPCMTFEYYFGLPEAAEIRVYAEDGQSRQLLWQHSGLHGDDETVGRYGWRLARVNLTVTNSTVYLVNHPADNIHTADQL